MAPRQYGRFMLQTPVSLAWDEGWFVNHIRVLLSFQQQAFQQNTQTMTLSRVVWMLFDDLGSPHSLIGGRCRLPSWWASPVRGRGTQSCTSKGIWRQGIGSFVRNSCVFDIMPCCHTPLLVHFWGTWTTSAAAWSPSTGCWPCRFGRTPPALFASTIADFDFHFEMSVSVKKHSSGEEDPWGNQPEQHNIRGWREVSAAVLQGQGSSTRVLFQTRVRLQMGPNTHWWVGTPGKIHNECLDCKCTYPFLHVFSRHVFSKHVWFPAKNPRSNLKALPSFIGFLCRR